MKKALIVLLALFFVLPLFASFDYIDMDIYIDGGDHFIPATLTLPVGGEGEKFPAVVMLHGNGSTRHEAGNAYDYAAPEMAKAGIATIRFDYIGNGDSKEDYIDFTYDKGIEDAMTCLDFLSTIESIDSERIGIMGWSQGGRLTLLTAARTDRFKAALTWAGAFDQKMGEEEQYEIALSDGYYEVTYDWRGPLKQSPEYYENAAAIDYYKEAREVKIPYFLIQGLLDTAVKPETAEEVESALVNAPFVGKYYIENGDHTFNVFTGDDSVLKETVEVTISFFLATLR